MSLMKHRWILASLIAASASSWASPAQACLFGAWRAKHRAKCDTCAPAACAVPVAPPIVAHYVTPAPPPQPIAVAETKMVQRCYVAPVTTMETRTQWQQVTNYQTHNYMEPVTTMRTSTYYDPCQCSYYNVATPQTNYVQRSYVTPVTNWVAQNYQVPVTKYEQRTVVEPVTEIKHYYPAVQAAPVVAQPMVAQPVVATYMQPVPAAIPAAPAVSAWTPVYPTPPSSTQLLSNQFNPTQLQTQQGQPQQGQPRPMTQGQAPRSQSNQSEIDRNYQTPNDPGSRTLLIERRIQNGQVIEENRKMLEPGQPIPAPKTQDFNSKPSIDSNNNDEIRKLKPLERTAFRSSGNVIQAAKYHYSTN